MTPAAGDGLPRAAARGQSPSPLRQAQPSPVEGEGVRAPISIFPPDGGRGGSPLPVRPSGFRPRIEYGAGCARERRLGSWLPAPHGEGGFQTRPYRAALRGVGPHQGSHPHPSPLPSRERGVRAPISIFPPKWGRRGITPARPPPLDSGPVSSTGQAVRRNDGCARSPPYRVRGRLCAGTTVGFPGFPRRTGRVSNPPLQSRATRCRAAPGESPSPQPSPVEGEGVRAPFHARYSVVLSGWRHQGGERPGCVESMGPAQGSGSCQCCLSFWLILRSAMVSSAGAGFSSWRPSAGSG